MSKLSKTVQADSLSTVVSDYSQSEDDSLVIPVSAKALDADSSYVSDLAFLCEPVEVMINPSNNPADSTRLLTVSVDGQDEFFMRGQWKAVKRYYVERLALAKRDQWQFGYRKGQDGSVNETSTAQQSLRYGFQVRDDNPKGRAWLQKLLEQPI